MCRSVESFEFFHIFFAKYPQPTSVRGFYEVVYRAQCLSASSNQKRCFQSDPYPHAAAQSCDIPANRKENWALEGRQDGRNGGGGGVEAERKLSEFKEKGRPSS